MELLKIRTDQFEGPLDLLLFLIQKHEMDVSKINIHEITDQYVQYIELMRELNFDVASEFLVMAATLIHLKSKRLLPDDELALVNAGENGEITSEAELIRRLLEYKKYQEAATQMRELPKLGEDVFIRPGVVPPERQTVWKEMDITGLTLAFQDVLRRSRKRNKVIIREPLSIQERIVQLSQLLKVGEMTEFASVMSADPDRGEIVVTFLSLLELARLKKIKIFQHETFGSIYIHLLDQISAMDPALISGFQYNAKHIEELATHASTG